VSRAATGSGSAQRADPAGGVPRLRAGWVLAGLALLTGVTVLLAPLYGGLALPWDVYAGGGTSSQSVIFWQIRVPQVITAFLAGAGLAVSGMSFQAMFRNPLATPFTLGVASGASLGAAIYIRSELSLDVPGFPGITLFAFVGALGAISIVYGLSVVRRGLSTAGMLLAGVAVSFFCSSLLMFIQYISRVGHSIQILHWVMGGLNVFGYQQVFQVLPFVVTGAAVTVYLSQELNLLLMGDDLAASRGVAVGRVKVTLFLVISLTVAGVVAVTGPIGFVGMMVPHIVRLVIGADHRVLTPACLLFGGTFLVLCDRLSRSVVPPADVPVGVITALLGGPFFLWLLLRRGVID